MGVEAVLWPIHWFFFSFNFRKFNLGFIYFFSLVSTEITVFCLPAATHACMDLHKSFYFSPWLNSGKILPRNLPWPAKTGPFASSSEPKRLQYLVKRLRKMKAFEETGNIAWAKIALNSLSYTVQFREMLITRLRSWVQCKTAFALQWKREQGRASCFPLTVSAFMWRQTVS